MPDFLAYEVTLEYSNAAESAKFPISTNITAPYSDSFCNLSRSVKSDSPTFAACCKKKSRAALDADAKKFVTV